MKKTTIVIFLFLLCSIAESGTWIPTGSLPSNCAIFTMTGTAAGDVLIFDYNASCVMKKPAGSNNWISSGLNGRKVRFLTTAPNGDVYAISGTGAYIINAYTSIHRSTDNGATWEDVFYRATPYSNSIGGAMVFLPDNSIMAAFPFQKGPTIGDYVTTMMCKSTNGGNSWFMTDSLQLGWPNGMIQINENKVFLGSSYDGIFYATLSGNHWWPVDTTAHFFGSRYTTDIVRSREGTIYAPISRKVQRSYDNGVTFSVLPIPSANPNASINSICAVSDNEVYIATDDEKVYLSTNAGNNWQLIINGLPAATETLYLKLIDNKLYLGTYKYGVYYYQPDGVSVSNENTSVNGFTLNQNYPNPFNPSTKISFAIPKSSFVNLTVFDMIGRSVSVLMNENKPAGNYEVNFDASDLSGGVYFYKLQTGDFTETRKMILTK
jgi:hypothetical protein